VRRIERRFRPLVSGEIFDLRQQCRIATWYIAASDMNSLARIFVAFGLVCVAAVGTAHAAQRDAAGYPTRPIRLMVPQNPGASVDNVSRILAAKMGEELGQQIVADNRPGAGGTLAAEVVAHAAPDGQTLFAVATGTAVISPQTFKKLSYDPIKDFEYISLFAITQNVLVVHPSLPVKSVKDLIALARARAGELNCGSSGNGSGSHMALELFNRMAGVRIMRIPYNGDGLAIIDLLGGQVPMKFDNLSTSLTHVRAGRLRPLGVTSPARTALLPEVPAISETVTGFQVSIFNGMMAPAATPPEIINRVHAEIVKFVAAPEIRSRFASQGVELQASATPGEFTAYIKSEYAKWAKVVDEAGIKAE
jgi:tripartite-type tricarboxylate transporter receptor subunit TctC